MTRKEAIAHAKEMISAYNSAEIAVLNAQSYTIKGRTLTRAHLAEIQKARKYWEKKLSSLKSQGTSMKIGSITPSW
jgi:hypothetical protein